MSVAAVYNKLGQNIVPRVSLKSMPDTMTIVETIETPGTGGGQIRTTDNAYTDVPCTYGPTKTDHRMTSGDQLVSFQRYTVTFPVYHEGSRIDIDPSKHIFIVDERGLEPEKTFRVLAIRDESGVIYYADCERENSE